VMYSLDHSSVNFLFTSSKWASVPIIIIFIL
jgi:hypothetical protein